MSEVEYLDEVGDPSAPTLVLVPGLDGTALLFYRQLPLLARRFKVVTFPLPVGPAKDMDELVSELAGVVSEISPQGAILLGESFGGALALATALAHPSLVEGLVVVNSFPWLDQRRRLWMGPRLLRRIPWAAMPLVRRFTEAQIHSSHTLPEDLAEFHERAKRIDREGYIGRLELLWDYDVRDRLREIEAPALFIAGDRDRLLPSVRWAHYMAERVPDAELEVLEGYGHACLINHDLDICRIVWPWWNAVTDDDVGDWFDATSSRGGNP